MEDYFICPCCGEELPMSSTFCPHCGSDEETGWSSEEYMDDLHVPTAKEEEEEEYLRFLERDYLSSNKSVWQKIIAWIVLAICVGLAFWTLWM